MHIAIIGAGLSGLVLANRLQDSCDITLFEKSRGVSGRMTTRYADPFQFDHGAQYFIARTDAFKEFLQPFIEENIIQEWHPKTVTLSSVSALYKRNWFEPHYVAAPKMNGLAKSLADGLDVQLQTEIASIEPKGNQWRLLDKEQEDLGLFDWVVCTAPAAQTYALMPETFVGRSAISGVRMTGCYSVMLGFDVPLALNWQAAVVKDSPIGWMALNSHKPGRETGFSLMVQSTNDWAEKHIDDEMSHAQTMLLDAIHNLLPNLPEPVHKAVHRWRYADTPEPLGQNFLIDETNKLAVCGDWCIGGRIEAAFTSASTLADELAVKLQSYVHAS